MARLAENANIGEGHGKGLICPRLGQAVVPCPPFIFTPAHMGEMFAKLEKALKGVFAEVA